MSLDSKNTADYSKIKHLYSNYKEITYPVLKDMFVAGLTRHGLSDEDDEFLDVTATILTKFHKDKTILPTIVDMIFFRNREGLFTHDLIWAFFQARDPYSLMLIANYLNSDDINDVKLACKLLDFVPSIDMNIEKDNKKQYMDFFNWLKENYSYLHFTGESYQRTSKPVPYIVALDAKYLCRQVSINTGKPFLPLTKRESNLLSRFYNLGEYKQLLLSKYSLRIYYENINLWKSWINHSITKQINIAESKL
ncbi:hypothetical protein LGK95_21535 [Clostridium algoriphilum]|uniref:hypothetical protein n=1 Tax=Clostridium algoriphilum TaxID=198347 RepID=UPI001CF4E4D5|nr:hypothetical protein [Clostridium algoriphilum]MCB2296037.1 hypothetical protein [Clostridium algoriphilum]